MAGEGGLIKVCSVWASDAAFLCRTVESTSFTGEAWFASRIGITSCRAILAFLSLLIPKPTNTGNSLTFSSRRIIKIASRTFLAEPGGLIQDIPGRTRNYLALFSIFIEDIAGRALGAKVGVCGAGFVRDAGIGARVQMCAYWAVLAKVGGFVEAGAGGAAFARHWYRVVEWFLWWALPRKIRFTSFLGFHPDKPLRTGLA